MVDSISSTGQGQPAQPIRKAQEPQKLEQKARDNAPVDEVSLSAEALNLSQAEDAARKVSSALADKPESTLSVDQERLSTLV